MDQTIISKGIINENPIIPAPTAILTFRDSGYKSTAAALAELIDNSIEAQANSIQVLTFEEPVILTRRTTLRIQKIAVYDNGSGMSPETLQLTLQFGMGTRLNSRKGIGRFGIGLPNASVSQCKLVTVYSWLNGTCYSTYLDIDEIGEKKQQNANPVIQCSLPMHILKHLEGELDTESGTLVVWEKCDRLDLSRSTTLYNRMEKDLCRIYRHFLDNDNSYGNQIDIKLIVTGQERHVLQLTANDPNYQLIPNNTPDHESKSTNLSHGNIITIEVPYDENDNTSTVEIRFTIALPEVQALGGGGHLGQHYKRNTGISFVRACREIDFGVFGFFNLQEERERWWGCEIRFEPVLDDLFGVTNNKQFVRNIRSLDVKEFEKERGEDWEQDLKDDHRQNLLYQLSKTFYGNHKKIMDTITDRGKGSKKKKTSGNELDIGTEEKSINIANKELEKSKDPTKSKIEGSKKTKEDIEKEWMTNLKAQVPHGSPEELANYADFKAQQKISFEFDGWPGEQFFTIEIRGSTPVVIFNKRHPFYTELYEPLSLEQDSKFSDALDLLMLAYARTEDELFGSENEKVLDKVRSKWGTHVLNFLNALKIEA